MVDNVTTPIPAGTVLATDDIGGVQYNIVKVSFGPLGTATPVSTASPMPVAVSGDALTAAQASAPATRAFAVTPSDTAALAPTANALYIGSAGSIVVRPSASGADVTFTSVPAGSILPVSVTAVRATGTTASGIIGLA